MDGTDMRDICIKEQALEEEEEEGAFAVSCEKRRQRMPRRRSFGIRSERLILKFCDFYANIKREDREFSVAQNRLANGVPRDIHEYIRLPTYVIRVYTYERIRIPTKAIPTPTIGDKEMISISTSLTRVSLPTRSKPIAQKLKRNIDYTARAWVLVCWLDGFWFTASRTFEDGGYSVTWLTEVEVAPRILALARLAFPVRRGSIARTRTVRVIDHDKIPTLSRSPKKFESPKVVCCQWLWRGELAGCNCIKLAVTRPCINHSCGSRRTAAPRRYNAQSTHTFALVHACTHRATYRLVWCLERIGTTGTSPLRHSIHRCLGFLKRSLCSTAHLGVM
ncbi:hypothetical protein G5I_11147 [Acromyrmex echinatior]|uniref:Uncharacterized protein n=1 Tax=Acromyrmex echinatior TaxID=103372 RepID=F4WYT3_ACREC|nr:hypothetical protein G5I_11147 [Acromyrmex echinatior]